MAQISSRSKWTHWPPVSSAPDALDESRHAVHGIAIVRHDAADVSLHVHQLAVVARKQQQPALACAVVCEWNLKQILSCF